jgi:hypothetical protein
MKTVQIQTNLFRVAIHAGKFTEYTAQNRIVTQPDDAEFYDEEEADILVETYSAMYPNANVQKEVVEETMTIDDLADAIADTYNSRSAGWDYQHGGGVREEHIAEYIATLENTLFCGADIRKHLPELLSYVEEPATIEEHAVTISGVFGSRFTACPYGTVYLFITLKK